MEKWIDRIFSLKTFPGKLVFVLWFTACVLVVFPEPYLERLSLLKFKNALDLYIGPTALITSAILIWMIVRYIGKRISSKKFIREQKELIDESIRSLNFNEVALLREFYLQANDTILIPYSNETVIALQNKGIVCMAANSAIVGIDMGYPFSLTTYAKKRISPRTLNLPETEREFTESRKRTITNERPDWAKEMLRRKQLLRGIW